MAKITLAGKEITLVLPASMAMRWEVGTTVVRSIPRGMGAAVGVCIPRGLWPIRDDKGKEKARPSYAYDMLEYGGQVVDSLTANGVSFEEIIESGKVALDLINSSVVTEEEVKAAEVFSNPPAGEEQGS